MSGICSRHQGHDPDCSICAVPVDESMFNWPDLSNPKLHPFLAGVPVLAGDRLIGPDPNTSEMVEFTVSGITFDTCTYGGTLLPGWVVQNESGDTEFAVSDCRRPSADL